jgi:hypothetical protein
VFVSESIGGYSYWSRDWTRWLGFRNIRREPILHKFLFSILLLSSLLFIFRFYFYYLIFLKLKVNYAFIFYVVLYLSTNSYILVDYDDDHTLFSTFNGYVLLY